MEEWINLPTDDDVKSHEGFIYITTNKITKKHYIGRATFWNSDRKKFTRKPTKVERERLERYKEKGLKKKYKEYKSELYNKYKGNKKTVLGRKESDWRNYLGSGKIDGVYFKDLKDKSIFRREILMLCKDKFEMAYYEALMQFSLRVLFRKDFYNGIINLRIPKLKKYR